MELLSCNRAAEVRNVRLGLAGLTQPVAGSIVRAPASDDREEPMADRLGLGLIQIDPGAGTGWRTGAIRDVARAAEDAGFEAIFCAEVNNDAMATTQLMGLSTQRIKVGTWVANIYIRLPTFVPRAPRSRRMRPRGG